MIVRNAIAGSLGRWIGKFMCPAVWVGLGAVLGVSITACVLAGRSGAGGYSVRRLSSAERDKRLAVVEAYYSNVSVPLPPGVGRMNTWRRAAFWRAFAEAYVTASSAIGEGYATGRDPRTRAFDLRCPTWVESIDEANAEALAKSAAQRRRDGMSEADVVTWVAEEYARSRERYDADMTDAWYGLLADGSVVVWDEPGQDAAR